MFFIDELRWMYDLVGKGVGDFVGEGSYWSSSEDPQHSGNTRSWYLDFGDRGYADSYRRDSNYYVRPWRAF